MLADLNALLIWNRCDRSHSLLSVGETPALPGQLRSQCKRSTCQKKQETERLLYRFHKKRIDEICTICDIEHLGIFPCGLAALDERGNPFVAVVAGKHFIDILPLDFVERFLKRSDQS